MELMTAITLGGTGKTVFFVGLMVMVFVVLRSRGAGSAAAAWTAIGQGALLVDVRSEQEFQGGHLDGAINVPHDRISQHLGRFGTDKNRPIVVYCLSGGRSALAKALLERNGFTQVINGGGYGALKAAKPTP